MEGPNRAFHLNIMETQPNSNKQYNFGKITKVNYIRSFYAHGVRYVAWEVTIESSQNIIDTNIQKVLKFIDQMLQYRITTYLNKGNSFFAEDFNLNNHAGFKSELAFGRFSDDNGQFFGISFKNMPCVLYDGWKIPMTTEQVNRVLTRKEGEPIQHILDPKIYPVWLRELLKMNLNLNPNEGYELTRFMFDPTFLKINDHA